MNTWTQIEIIEVAENERGSLLYLSLCQYAGTPISESGIGPGEEITPQGYLTPYATAGRLRQALNDANAEVRVFRRVVDGLQVGVTWAAIDSQNPRRAAVCSQGDVPRLSPTDAIARALAQYPQEEA